MGQDIDCADTDVAMDGTDGGRHQMRTNRCVDVLVGLSAGSEAKGKLASLIADRYDYLVRTGACNAAHTTYLNGEGLPWHQLSCVPLHNKHAILVLGAGAQVDMKYLNREIGWLKERNAFYQSDGTPRLVIDPSATVIDQVDVDAENGWSDICGPQWYKPTTCDFHNGTTGPDGASKPAYGCEGCSLYPKDSLHRAVGSTTHGSGFNLIRKLARADAEGYAGMLRDKQGNKIPRVKQAWETPALAEYIADTVGLLNSAIDSNLKILLEGTQGSVLSMHHGPWPKTTSRDTNAANWLMEAGIAPHAVRDVYGVTRTYPIRVFGNSGPMGGKELTWEDVTKDYYNLPRTMHNYELDEWLHVNNKIKIEEITTATKRRRRVFEFSIDDLRRAYKINRPTHLMLSFIDYLGEENFGVNSWEKLTPRARAFIEDLEKRADVFFDYLSTGPEPHQMIERSLPY